MLKLLILVTILHLTTSQLAAINNPIIFVDDNLGFDDEDLVLPAVQTTFARALQPDCITSKSNSLA